MQAYDEHLESLQDEGTFHRMPPDLELTVADGSAIGLHSWLMMATYKWTENGEPSSIAIAILD